MYQACYQKEPYCIYIIVHLSKNSPPYAQMTAIKRKGIFSDVVCIVYYEQEVTTSRARSYNNQNRSFIFVIILSLCASICANNTAKQHNVFQSYFYTMIVLRQQSRLFVFGMRGSCDGASYSRVVKCMENICLCML